MAAREQSGTNIEPGLVQRIVQGFRYAVSGVNPQTDFFGPGQPIAPQAQDRAEGRQFDYPVGFNYRIQPRGEESISFAQLRALADNYDLMRLIIEKRKDQIEAFDWEIVPCNKDDSADDFKSDIDEITEFLGYPDKQNNHNWQQWLRQIIEELLVIDTVCVYPQLNRGGGMYGLQLVDGALIKRVIDVTGRTPLPPSPAYQQILKGIPAVDYTSDELVYMMRNPRVWKLYGFSPVEQVVTTVNIALRRQMSQLEFYTVGNIPDALVRVPDTWNPKQIDDFQLRFDSMLEGNTAARRKIHFIPNVGTADYPTKDKLKDEMDEWLARIVCFAFSISPSALIKQVNRASGEQMADTAKEEGLIPLLRFVESFMSFLVQVHLKKPKLRFSFKVVNRVDPLSQATIHKTYIDSEVMTPDQVREDLGMDAMTPEQREAAFPTPIPPGMNPDGTPILPKGAEGGEAEPQASGAQPKPDAGSGGGAATPAEKMLADLIKMLDPAQVAKVIAEAAKASAPNVVELRPEVNVGDVNVHVPAAREKSA